MNNEINAKKQIFIVEDEPDIQKLIAINLEKSGYEVDKFSEAGPMLAMLKKKIPDLLILDLMLPDHDGLDICKILKNNKKYPDFPIIMVTARTEELDVVLGLELGADDYIAKPFSPRELVARVKAVLRRNKPPAPKVSKKIVIGDILSIDLAKYEVLVNNEKIQLTATEFLILKTLAEKPGWVFPRGKILHALGGDEKSVFERTVDVHIKNLREKLGSAGNLLKNVRGVGYKIEC